jgi:hypothetical protein
MVVLCELLLRTNDLSLQDPLTAHQDQVATTNQFGSINRWRSDMMFSGVPLRSLIGEAQWRANPEAMLILKSWDVYYAAGGQPQSQQSNTLFISGHNPSVKEWRSCDTESDARYLATRADPNQGQFGNSATNPTDKNVNSAPQLIRLSEDVVQIRLRLSPTTASNQG